MDCTDVTPYIAAWREQRRQEQKQLTERLETGRNLFRNIYAFELKWHRVYSELHRQVETFLSFPSELDQATSG